MFHRFPELGATPCLVRSLDLDYADLNYTQPVAIDDELAHQGSTRFASFIQAITQSGYVRDQTPALAGDGVTSATYIKKSPPPLELQYSKPIINDDIHDVEPGDLANLPIGVDGAGYRWVDLNGEGVSGVLTEQADTWFYKPNLGAGHFGPLQTIPAKPAVGSLKGGASQLIDLAGDGRLDLVNLGGPVPGFNKRGPEDAWEPFRTFRALPDLPWSDPNLRFVDLTGDGHADILLTENEVVSWHGSLAEEGFGAGRRVHQPADEEAGPRLVFVDAAQSVYLADMSGDGLSDLVRIRNGAICYWPNQGYGRFGAKVTMDNSPWFDRADLFDQSRIRIADIDGSGTADLIYLGGDGVRLYFNQSGNRLGDARPLRRFPPVDTRSAVTTADLLGTGTACLVWSSQLPSSTRRPVRYVDLMGGGKPHLLVRAVNNLGAETHVGYASSTVFYLEDQRAGTPWITQLPFPVHVVERIETRDLVSRNRFVARYTYHHGYFDAAEREFHGFGRVDRCDTEELAVLGGADDTAWSNADPSSQVPPVLTRTWFHTGVYLGGDHVSDYFAGLLDGGDVGEYYREPGLSDAQARAVRLGDTAVPAGLGAEEQREACRALKSSLLRQEVYGLDESPAQPHPYKVIEQNFSVRVLQRRHGNRHPVLRVDAREVLVSEYDRRPDDPRVAHSVTLEVDDFGNELRSITAGYGRRAPAPELSAADSAVQARHLVTYTENDVTNAVDSGVAHRNPLPAETRTYELTGVMLVAGQRRLSVAAAAAAAAGAVPVDPEQAPTPGLLQRRLVERKRVRYRADDLSGPLGLRRLESRALPYEQYRLAFTPDLLNEVYGPRVTDAMLADEGRYVHEDGDWWIPSGRVFYSPDPADSPARELDHARAHFFLPHRSRDPFHTVAVSTEAVVTYDAYDLMPQETCDPLGNRVTVGERDLDPSRPLLRTGHDYRVLQPTLLMDPNRNRATVAFDALAMVVGTAVMGKPEDTPALGDRLTADFDRDLTRAQIAALLGDPRGPTAATLLGDATTRVVYDLTSYPSARLSISREAHVGDPVPPDGPRLQVGVAYSDGLGREIQHKTQAEPGPVPVRDAAGRIVLGPDGRPTTTAADAQRWVASGWTVYNNKGRAVREYEPFFTDTLRYEFDVRVGVSPIMFYDPADRVVGTLFPDHTWEKTVFGPWRQISWDPNDTVLVADPGTDPDIGAYLRRLPPADYLPTWYARRSTGAFGTEERAAADKTAVHADTPLTQYTDALGRTFLTVAHNRSRYSDAPAPIEEFHRTRVTLDIQGDELISVDAQDRVVLRQRFDLRRTRIMQASMDAGHRWMLNDVSGRITHAWDGMGRRRRTSYDALRRPTATWLRLGDSPEILVGRTLYGESTAAPETGNTRGRAVQVFDQAGVATSDRYDFKGNLCRSQRRLATTYATTLDWSTAVPLEPDTYTSETEYDALNREVRLTTPDGSVLRPGYNDARLLERVHVDLRGELRDGQPVWTPVLTGATYTAEGRRARTDHGNGTSTSYAYDPVTARLTGLRTGGATGPALQQLSFTSDAVGNTVHVRDDAQQSVFFRNRLVEPSADYTYDSVYRLIEATGREHLGQVGGAPVPHSHHDKPRVRLPWSANDGNALGRYRERFEYDPAGNPLTIRHTGTDPVAPGWTRTHVYREPSRLEPGMFGNRLSSATTGASTEVFSTAGDGYDGNGNMLRMPHLPAMEWNFRDQLQMTRRQAVAAEDTGERTYYTYDAGGQRVRKITELSPGVVKDECIYLGGFEVYRRHGSSPVVRETLHVMDDKQRLAVVETRTEGTEPDVPERLIRFQLTDQLGSARLELDEAARILSYEEYTPYGSTSYQAVQGQIAAKRYRWTGKERDEESGLYYHGARYYAAWLARWTSCERIQRANLYLYVGANPIQFTDPDGREESSSATRLWGAVRRVGGAAPAVGGVAVLVQVEVPVAAQVVGGVAIVHGYSDMVAGLQQIMSGKSEQSPIEKTVSGVAQLAKVPKEDADRAALYTDVALGFVNPAGPAAGGPRAAMALAANGPRLANATVQVSRTVQIVNGARQVSQVAHAGLGIHAMASTSGGSSNDSGGSSGGGSDPGAGSGSAGGDPPAKTPNNTQVPDEYFDEAARTMGEDTLQRPQGALLQDLTRYGDAPAARKELGTAAQGAHFTPQSAVRDLPGFSPRNTMVRMLGKVVHSGMDSRWLSDLMRRWFTTGQKTISAGELFDTVSAAIRANPHFSPGEAQSMIELLEDELRINYGLKPGDPTRAPFSR